MTATDLLNLLRSFSDEEFAFRHVLEPVPFIFGPSAAGFHTWREAVASFLQTEPASVFLVGSAATGYSLSPEKPARLFRPITVSAPERPSDIDLAIVAPEFFLRTWETLLTHDRRRTLRMRRDQIEKMRRYIYFGALFDYTVPANTDAARALRAAVSHTRGTLLMRGHRVTIKLYRTHKDLAAYQAFSIARLRQVLEGAI